MEHEDYISDLERAWNPDDGFLGQLRQGIFREDLYEEFINMLRDIETGDFQTVEEQEENYLNHRFVSLTWYIPTFMRWQTDRVEKKGDEADVEMLEKALTEIRTELERILGIP